MSARAARQRTAGAEFANEFERRRDDERDANARARVSCANARGRTGVVLVQLFVLRLAVVRGDDEPQAEREEEAREDERADRAARRLRILARAKRSLDLGDESLVPPRALRAADAEPRPRVDRGRGHDVRRAVDFRRAPAAVRARAHDV